MPEILMCTPPSSHVCDFSPKDSPEKIVENAFYFINKAFFVLKIIKFLYFAFANFFPSQPLLEKIIEAKS